MELPEVWLRGPIDNIPALLQPVAHAIVQSAEEVEKLMYGFPNEKLWMRPAGVASVGFHLQHLTGVLDRLFTYARGESLNDEQLRYLKTEGTPPNHECTVNDLVQRFKDQITVSLERLKHIPETSILSPVSVGRKKLPSTVLGLLFHAAEHTQRHTGQLLVTVRVLTD
ncbi:DinB family protein [Chryseolinea sp. H1M3-3]|uniref:DinB family protein n=1 Tax=Chryseolinea sp. H1M3-3 TaxID=3034144 RepID=UPI0023EB071A|nr:DinB family protein [Chryseolinea sp. H1M3-3]